jgi:hypothetical protein
LFLLPPFLPSSFLLPPSSFPLLLSPSFHLHSSPLPS